MERNQKKKSKYTVSKKDANGVLTKKPITHLYFNDRHLTVIENKTLPQTLCVLYLHNNAISTIEHLESATNLQSLYLQKNRITKIQNLNELRNLRKLYLGHNKISVLEGLEKLENLEELHIEKQRLLNREPLCFDPRTIHSLSKSLQFLNIANNNITDISQLIPLRFIKLLNANYNNLSDSQEVSDVLNNWCHLKEASFIGNPLTKIHRYRENIIANTNCLALLDSKPISETTRNFMKRFEKEKINQSNRQTINLVEKVSGIAKTYPMSIQKAVSQSILKSKPCFDNSTLHSDANDIHIPWKSMPKSASNIKHKYSRTFKMQPKLHQPNLDMFPSRFGHFNK